VDDQPPTGQGARGELITALVVDDNPYLANLMTELLGKLAGIHAVAIAIGGESGLDLATTYNVDLVLTDIDMPGTNGLRLASLLRERLPNICIIVTSGDACWEKAALASGADSFISKPDLVDRLAGEVERLRQKGVLARRTKGVDGDHKLSNRPEG